jgi:hypothetical protein
LRHQAARGALFGRLWQFVDMRARLALPAAGEALVHNAADGARTPSALRAAPEAAVNLVGSGGPGRGSIDRRPDVAIGKNVAGTNDHKELKSLTWLADALI